MAAVQSAAAAAALRSPAQPAAGAAVGLPAAAPQGSAGGALRPARAGPAPGAADAARPAGQRSWRAARRARGGDHGKRPAAGLFRPVRRPGAQPGVVRPAPAAHPPALAGDAPVRLAAAARRLHGGKRGAAGAGAAARPGRRGGAGLGVLRRRRRAGRGRRKTGLSGRFRFSGSG
ncbi:hypothetical protein OF001_U310035 [Pseudomonas sp. OF001]|nr:hypothetical protein OF001_U310035 [Pseudomonas sp. OF001]